MSRIDGREVNGPGAATVRLRQPRGTSEQAVAQRGGRVSSEPRARQAFASRLPDKPGLAAGAASLGPSVVAIASHVPRAGRGRPDDAAGHCDATAVKAP